MVTYNHRHGLPCSFLSSHSSSCPLTLIHWLCRSPSPQVTMTESPVSRFVTLLWSDHCCPMGSALEVDMQLGVLKTSGSMPCPWVSFCLHTQKTFVFLAFLTKIFFVCLFHFIAPVKTHDFSLFPVCSAYKKINKNKVRINTKAHFLLSAVESS